MHLVAVGQTPTFQLGTGYSTRAITAPKFSCYLSYQITELQNL